MQELDVMLGGWLDECWVDADEQQRLAFDRLLEVEDDRLWNWLLGRSRPEAAYKNLIETIRERHFGPSSR